MSKPFKMYNVAGVTIKTKEEKEREKDLVQHRQTAAPKYKMKYTNGKKADPSAFPFAQTSQFDSSKARNTLLNTIGGGSTEQVVGKKIDDEIRRTVVSSIDKSEYADILKEGQN